MSIYIDYKYAVLLSTKLPLFKQLGKNKANFRCPLCGDSDKSKFKKRGYFYPLTKEDKLMMCCHNCGASHKFSTFLKMQDELLYKEYIRENFKFDNEHRWSAKKTEDKEDEVVDILHLEAFQHDPIQKLDCIIDLPTEHPCKQYVLERKIPFRFWKELYYTDNYKEFIHENIDKTKFEKIPDQDPRLVIPFINKKNQIFAYQGRTILKDPTIIRYITIRKNEEGVLLYGFNRVDPKQDNIYVLEGPIDSMFLPNAIAVAGSALSKMIDKKMKKLVFIFDNEPRSKEICALIQKTIDAGCRVVIFPEKVKEKDLNQMIENGYTTQEVLDMVNDNVYNNTLTAQLKFNKWKKI